MDNVALQIKIICLVSILAGILSAVIPKGKMKSSFVSLSAVVLIGAIIIPLRELKNIDFSSLSFEKEQVSISLEADVNKAESIIYESVVRDALETYFSEREIKSRVNVECENKGGGLTVVKITVFGAFTDEEKIYMTEYISTCFEKAEINFKEAENG